MKPCALRSFWLRQLTRLQLMCKSNKQFFKNSRDLKAESTVKRAYYAAKLSQIHFGFCFALNG